MPIPEMSVGPELDWQIAIEIMGWTYIRPAANGLYGIPPGHTGASVPVPHYSTDWGAAGALVERITATDGPHSDQKWSFDLEYSSVVDWVADFTPRRHHPQSREYGAFQRSAFTAPHAICLAALAALASEKAPHA